MTKAFGGRLRVLDNNKGTLFWGGGNEYWSPPIGVGFVRSGVKYLGLPDDSHISASVMEGETSVTWQRGQVHKTKALVVTPNPDAALR